MNLNVGGSSTVTSTFPGVIKDGTAKLTLLKTGSGTLTLSGVNAYSGGTSLAGGTLNINADAALGTVPSPAATNLTFSASSTLQAGGTVSLIANRNVSIGSGFTATLDTNGNAMTVGGIISGAGGAGQDRHRDANPHRHEHLHRHDDHHGRNPADRQRRHHRRAVDQQHDHGQRGAGVRPQ